MTDLNEHRRPPENARSSDHVRETTVVTNSGSGGWIAALAVVVLLGIGAFIFFNNGSGPAVNSTAPATETNVQVNPAPETAPAAEPAPAAPAAAATDAAPAAPEAPAPAAPAN